MKIFTGSKNFDYFNVPSQQPGCGQGLSCFFTTGFFGSVRQPNPLHSGQPSAGPTVRASELAHCLAVHPRGNLRIKPSSSTTEFVTDHKISRGNIIVFIGCAPFQSRITFGTAGSFRLRFPLSTFGFTLVF